MANLENKTDAEIDQWIANHERAGEAKSALYQELIVELNRRHGKGLDIQVSLEAMTNAAVENRFISYEDLAAANGLAWSKARLRMNGSRSHLDHLLSYCHSHGLPLLTAIVVGKKHVDKGEMDETALNGFVEGARRLGISVSEPDAFLKQCQSECFEWVPEKTSSENVVED